jgi:hypothetical protein
LSRELDLTEPLEFDPHALRRMAQRGVSHRDILTALRTYHTSYPAQRLPGVAIRGEVYVGRIGERDLIVWVEPDSKPVYIRSDARRGEKG